MKAGPGGDRDDEKILHIAGFVGDNIDDRERVFRYERS